MSKSATMSKTVTMSKKPGTMGIVRLGLSLIELLMALGVTAIISSAIMGVAVAVQEGSDYVQDMANVTQHGRVSLERITRAAAEASAAEKNSGFMVVETTVGGSTFPDVLVVWKPEAPPANPDGPALVKELVIFCADSARPNVLLEMTAPSASRSVVLDDMNSAAGRALIDGLKISSATKKVQLTDKLRTAAADSSGKLRPALRFERRLRPSESEWNSFRSGSLSWQNINWPQGIHGANTGLCQAWLRIELQLVAASAESVKNGRQTEATPFFGSACCYFDLHK